MAERIRGFEPAAETHTHVLLDSWYSVKAIWSSAHARGFDSSCGLKANRLMRINDPEAKNGWRRQDLRTYAGRLIDADYQEVVRPQQEDPERSVWVHTLTTIVRNLGRCQVILVRDSLTAPVKEVRFWASSDLDADAATLIRYLAVRWDIEVLFADTKDRLGLDQYQLIDECDGHPPLLDPGAGGLRLSGRRARTPGRRSEPACHHWRRPANHPARPLGASAQLAAPAVSASGSLRRHCSPPGSVPVVKSARIVIAHVAAREHTIGDHETGFGFIKAVELDQTQSPIQVQHQTLRLLFEELVDYQQRLVPAL
jgi:hypothetical protein